MAWAASTASRPRHPPLAVLSVASLFAVAGCQDEPDASPSIADVVLENDRTLRLTTGTECPLRLSASVDENGESVTVSLHGERDRERPCAREVALESSVTVTLTDPLGTRQLIDANCPDDEDPSFCTWSDEANPTARFPRYVPRRFEFSLPVVSAAPSQPRIPTPRPSAPSTSGP